MFANFWHWLLHDLWGYWPFTSIGWFFSQIFGQQTLAWVGDHFAWLTVCIVMLGSMTLEFIYWAWAWIRGRQIDYDPERAEFWTTGPRAGQAKAKPVKLERARARRYAWPRVGLPLYLVAVSMYISYLLWPGSVSSLTLALLWFVFGPVRRAMCIAAARKAYLANNPNDRLTTTLRQDVWDYFVTGVSRPPSQKRYIEPPFEDTNRGYKFLNWGHATFSRYGTFWRVFRFWNVVRFWGIVTQLVIAFFWPIAAIVAPFFYMKCVEDYQRWMTPWWRRYRKMKYRGKVIEGQVVETSTTKVSG